MTDIDQRIRRMRSAVRAFGRLSAPEDRWFVASILMRKHSTAFQEAIRLTPEFEPYPNVGCKRTEPSWPRA